jgi:cell division protein ZapA (FtsZ GTPase activity inhibitor)
MDDITLIPVNIVIGDRNYRIKIKPEDEEAVRKTLKTINEKILEFKTQFAGQDMQDYVAMVLVWYATTTAAEGPQWQQNDLKDQLNKLEQLLHSATPGERD